MQLSSEDKKRLRGEHPLFTKLSGDVVWALFEEAGFDAEECEMMMDETLGGMSAVLDVMHAVESGRAQGFVLVAEEDACPHRLSLNGAFVPGAGPWRRLLPPYAVGCSITCRAAEAKRAATEQRAMERPACGLLCPLLEPMLGQAETAD